MKVIFLDFDGVITTHKSGWALDEKKLILLGEIIKKTGAKLVISSSWRRHNLENTIKHLSTVSEPFVPFPFPFVDDVYDITPRISISEYTRYSSVPRGVEIKVWLDEQKWGKSNPIENYVILDDDSDMLLEQKDHFIKTKSLTGLDEEDVENAIKILNGE